MCESDSPSPSYRAVLEALTPAPKTILCIAGDRIVRGGETLPGEPAEIPGRRLASRFI